MDCFRAKEHHGLVWVALEAPRWRVPDIPEFADPQWKVVRTGPFAWQCDASRQLENFTDFGHFAFVHPGLLGDPEKPVVAPYEVEIEGHILRYQYGRPDQKNSDDFPVFTDAERKDALRRTRYEIHLPFTLVEHIDWGGRDGLVYLFASQPVDEEHCIGYCLVARNYNLAQPDTVLQGFEETIFCAGPAYRRIPAPGCGAVQCARRDAHEVRRRGDELPPRHPRAGAGLAAALGGCQVRARVCAPSRAGVGCSFSGSWIGAAMQSYDRAGEDVSNIVHLEHVNLTQPDQRLATLFYVAGLGGTRDPYLMVGLENMWVNLGRSQMHLPRRRCGARLGRCIWLRPRLTHMFSRPTMR